MGEGEIDGVGGGMGMGEGTMRVLLRDQTREVRLFMDTLPKRNPPHHHHANPHTAHTHPTT